MSHRDIKPENIPPWSARLRSQLEDIPAGRRYGQAKVIRLGPPAACACAECSAIRAWKVQL